MKELPFARPHIDDSDRAAVMEVLNGHILTHGPACTRLEQAFSQFVGEGAYCVSMSSCMAALHMSYFSQGIGPGDEVLVPALTHVATAHAVEMVGARPVFVDARPQDGNLDPVAAAAAVGPKTRALSLVHFVGIPGPVAELAGLDLKVVEDCALAVGSRLPVGDTGELRHVGMWGDCGCFSFYPVKHLTTGEGGMFLTKDPDLARKVALERAFGVDRQHHQRRVPGLYDVVALGLNYRMSELQAALGCSQMAKIEKLLERRRQNFTRLKNALSEVCEIQILDGPGNSHYCLTVVVAPDRRSELQRSLKEDGIGTSIYYPQPVPRMSYYRERYGYRAQDFPVAEAISDGSLALPVGPHLEPEDMDRIAARLKEALARCPA